MIHIVSLFFIIISLILLPILLIPKNKTIIEEYCPPIWQCNGSPETNAINCSCNDK